jgi:hypothetical protein
MSGMTTAQEQPRVVSASREIACWAHGLQVASELFGAGEQQRIRHLAFLFRG